MILTRLFQQCAFGCTDHDEAVLAVDTDYP